MNKEQLVLELSKRLQYPVEFCYQINDILEENFFFSKSYREKTIDTLVKDLKVSEEEAISICDTAMEIIQLEMKQKMRHPFRSQN